MFPSHVSQPHLLLARSHRALLHRGLSLLQFPLRARARLQGHSGWTLRLGHRGRLQPLPASLRVVAILQVHLQTASKFLPVDLTLSRLIYSKQFTGINL